MNIQTQTQSAHRSSGSFASDTQASRIISQSTDTGAQPSSTVTLSPLANALAKAARIDVSTFLGENAAPPQPVDDGKVLKAVNDPKGLAEGRLSLLSNAIARKSPEGAEAFREAARNGTLNIYKAADIPGVNYQTTITQIEGGQKHSVRNDPSPDVKAMIEAGRAIAFWNQDLGDLFLTW